MTDRIHKRGDAILVASFIGSILLMIPIGFLLWYGLYVFRDYDTVAGPLLKAIALTLYASALASIVVFLVFTPLSYELARRKHRILDAISDIPASIPHPIVGIAILIMASPITPFGRFLSSIGLNFFDSVLGMTTALAFVSAPIYIRSAQSIFTSSALDPEIYATSLGMSRSRIIYGLLIPQHLREFVSSFLTAMSRGMSEFGSIAIIAEYISGGIFSGTYPASVLIYQYYGYLGPQVAVTAAALMIMVSLALLAAIKIVLLRQRTERRYF